MNESFTTQRDVTLRFLASPTEVNAYGNIHGGSVMKWIDEAAYICAAGWCGQAAVTVYVGGIRFSHPVHVGNVVEVDARLIYTGTTSMHIAVNVRAGSPQERTFTNTTHCVIVYVALDKEGKPSPVPRWVPETEEDRSLEAYALRLMDLRKGIESEMEPWLKS